MRYETFLFTRNQRQDFTAFVRPAHMTNREVGMIGGIFNYITDISRLTPEFPSLYCFPLGGYLLLLRHYNSDRKHAGRAIGVIEGIAVNKDESGFLDALAPLVDQQARLLDVSAEIGDIEALETTPSTEHEWNESSADKTLEPFVGAFLARRDQDRLFLPFNAEGRKLLVTTLADRRFTAPPFFAFGTNSDVLAQLGKQGQIDIVSFFKTDRASFRNRRTNSVSGSVLGDEDDTNPDPSMSLRTALQDERNLRPRRTEQPISDDDQVDQETMVGSDAISIRAFKSRKPNAAPVAEDDDNSNVSSNDDDSTILTMRQLRDRIRAEEAANQPTEPEAHSRDPLHWLLNLVSSFFSPNKPKSGDKDS